MKILIIEDSPDIADLLSRALVSFFPKAECFYAFNKLEALNILKNNSFFIITLDGRLLNHDHGQDVLEEMSPEEIEKTIVCSAEIDFVSECKIRGIATITKGSDLFRELKKVLQEKNLI